MNAAAIEDEATLRKLFAELDSGRVSVTPASTAVAVDARLPPIAHKSARTLPAVLIHADLVDQVTSGGEAGERALGDLLRLGEAAVPAVFARFPGPISIAPDQFGEKWPRPFDCGPVLRIVSSMRRLALPFLVARSGDAEADVRFWATYLIGDLHYRDAVAALLPRLFDENASVRRVALRAAETLSGERELAPAVREGLERVALSPDETEPRRVVAVDTLGLLGIAGTVPALIGLLSDPVPAVATAARRGLTSLTRRDLGESGDRWSEWWKHEAGEGV